MADYSQLTHFIDERIYDNDENAITGSILNYVLSHMVEILGNGFLFKGIINPESSILTPDTNIFYVGFAGTYGQFDSQTYTVRPGEIGFFAYDGDWHVGIGQVSSGGGGGGGDFDPNNLMISLGNLSSAEIPNLVSVALSYNAGTSENPNWIYVSTPSCRIGGASLTQAGVLTRDVYRKLYADNHRTKTHECFPYAASTATYVSLLASKTFYASCIQELWLDPDVYGDRSEYRLEYAMISKFSLRKIKNSSLECAFKIVCIPLGGLDDPRETIIDFSTTLPLDPTAQTLVEVPSIIHNADYSCVAVINWNAGTGGFTGYEEDGSWRGGMEAPEQYRLTGEAAIFDLSYSPTIKQFLENRNSADFDYEKLQLYLNLNMTTPNQKVIGLRYNVGTVQSPDWVSLGGVLFDKANRDTGDVGFIDGFSYGYLLARLQQTKPHNSFPFKYDETDSSRISSRVVDELWIDSTAYTLQQVQTMRVTRLLVNYNDNGDTICEFKVVIPSNPSDLSQPWNDVISYRKVVTSSNRPDRVIFNADKTVWAVINWNNTLMASGHYKESEPVSGYYLDETGKLFDLNYAPTIQMCQNIDSSAHFTMYTEYNATTGVLTLSNRTTVASLMAALTAKTPMSVVISVQGTSIYCQSPMIYMNSDGAGNYTVRFRNEEMGIDVYLTANTGNNSYTLGGEESIPTMTQAQYDAIQVKDPNKLYYIKAN